VPGLRAILVAVPPLLADILRHVLISRAGLQIVAEIPDLPDAEQRLPTLAPDIVIVGPDGPDGAHVRAALPEAMVLTLSRDLREIRGPGADDALIFTPETLVERLRQKKV
jgi:hypothetical protein